MYFRWITLLAGVLLFVRFGMTVVVLATGHGIAGIRLMDIAINLVLASFFCSLFARQMK